ncbi:hypothetical protein DDI_1894 [Dickeya dianthicola RNS04.9]|nr:hypothetical protein DDI_1894 [Dickeya dianthicola RNS04.9]
MGSVPSGKSENGCGLSGLGKGCGGFWVAENVLFLSLLIFPTRWRGTMTYLAALRG